VPGSVKSGAWSPTPGMVPIGLDIDIL